ncbi:MAG TPA: biotin--[acetyl-CoA-carboxylase] ligase [Steroidobacteraceae bacterium]|nr:biotin--[acetyl-CoA-carboxylase] ligase [Steroidobacteraceae bacterium]
MAASGRSSKGAGGDEVGAADRSGAGAPLVARVFAALADGEFHSGEELAETLGVSRSAVWKAGKALRDLGATLHAVRNRGYKLVAVSEPLDASKIREHLARGVRDRVRSLDVAWSVSSSNTILLERAYPPNGVCEVFLAEYQTAGRGRRGRTWVAPPGGAICLSLSWTFREVPADLGALSLVIGVCSLRALASLGVDGARLKWPNDLLVEDRKLGGILIELRAETAGPACVVIGVGLNVALGAPLLQSLADTGVAATDLASAGLAGRAPRNELAASLIGNYVRGLLEFEKDGLKPFSEEWKEVDALRGRPVTVQGMEGTTKGLARGIDLHGALLVETPHGLKKFISGDVSVRATT